MVNILVVLALGAAAASGVVCAFLALSKLPLHL